MSDTGTRGFHRTDPADEPAGKPLSGGVIAAIVFAVIVAVVLLEVAICCVRRWKKNRRAHRPVVPPRDRVPAEAAVVHTQAQGQVTSTSSSQGTEESPDHHIDVEVCGICRRGYANAQPEVLECRHGFHWRCIQRWRQVNLSCPICNATSIVLPGDTPAEASARHGFTSSVDFDLHHSKDNIDPRRSSFHV